IRILAFHPKADIENLEELLQEDNFVYEYGVRRTKTVSSVDFLKLKESDIRRERHAFIFLHSSYSDKEAVRPLLGTTATLLCSTQSPPETRVSLLFSNRTCTLYHAHHVTGDGKRHRNQRRTKGVTRLVEGGAVSMVAEVMAAMPEEGVTILEAVVKRGGLVAVAAAYVGIKRLGAVLREGAATLVTMCRKGGSEVVTELAAVPGVERIIWELMAVGSVRRRRY
ncbi:hypothetical protein V8G54_005913, partial [Vigna mungo]